MKDNTIHFKIKLVSIVFLDVKYKKIMFLTKVKNISIYFLQTIYSIYKKATDAQIHDLETK